MARGVKGSGKTRIVKSVEEKIAENDALIESLQAKLAEAKAKRKELSHEKENADFVEIQKIIRKSGMTPGELKELIGNK